MGFSNEPYGTAAGKRWTLFVDRIIHGNLAIERKLEHLS